MPEPLEMEYLARNLALEAELLRVIDLLAPHRVITFKGPVLTRKLYGSLSKRVSSDVDILVEPGALDDVVGRLIADGYVSPIAEPIRAIRSRNAALNFHKTSGEHRRSLDVHRLAFTPYLFSVPSELVEEHLEWAAVQGRPVLTFDAPLAFAHLVVHFVQHQFEVPVLRDVGRAWTVWSDVLEPWLDGDFVDRTCTREALEYALHVAHELGFTERPVPPLLAPRARAVARLFSPERLRASAASDWVNRIGASLLVRPTAVPFQALLGAYLALPEPVHAAWQRVKVRVRGPEAASARI